MAGADEKLNLAWVGIGNQGGAISGVAPAATTSSLSATATRKPGRGKWEEYSANPDKRVPKTLPRVKCIHRDWIESIRNGTPACSDFSYSGPMTEAILLGALAIRTGKSLKWNADSMEITGNPEAAKLINPQARKGWRPEDLA